MKQTNKWQCRLNHDVLDHSPRWPQHPDLGGQDASIRSHGLSRPECGRVRRLRDGWLGLQRRKPPAAGGFDLGRALKIGRCRRRGEASGLFRCCATRVEACHRAVPQPQR